MWNDMWSEPWEKWCQVGSRSDFPERPTSHCLQMSPPPLHPQTASPWDWIRPWDKKQKELKFDSLALTIPPFITFPSATWALCKERMEPRRTKKLDLRGDRDSKQDGGGSTDTINSGYLWVVGLLSFCYFSFFFLLIGITFFHVRYVFLYIR